MTSTPPSASSKVIALSIISLVLPGSNAAASTEYVCTRGKLAVSKADTAACYSDNGCAFIVKLGADPVREFDQASAPYALARGKIVAIVTSYPALIRKVKSVGGSCSKLESAR